MLNPKSGYRRQLIAGTVKKEQGFTLIELLIAGAILAILVVITLNTVLGRRKDNQVNEVVQLAGGDIPQALVSIYTTSGNTYASLTAAAGPGVLATKGIRSDMPWGGNWTVSGAGNATSVALTFPSDTNDTAANQLAEAVNVYNIFCTAPTAVAATCANASLQTRYRRMISSVEAKASSVVVTYSNPK